MTLVRWVETLGIVFVIMLGTASYQITQCQHLMEAEAEHAELVYLRAWRLENDHSTEECRELLDETLRLFILALPSSPPHLPQPPLWPPSTGGREI
jgi:hypothetical protein